ncbi:two-component sensor histidine kinase [Vibrio sp. S9_S30]|uniref:ATP-binding protein n=1 Tax=Vibrio sp. S9_S30 TaxID=2720226 RepID=UPI00168100C3|nr:ATP-binding protein [Vibrio sp. S9_S30]MBD1559315.1 two-component sensor histidine kinase [Vibrio sp. S9_S30]
MIKAFSILWLVILVPIALFFSPFGANPLSHISNTLAKDFYQNIYGPTLKTLHEDLNALPSENWQQYIEDLQPHFGVNLKLVDIADFPLSETNLSSLQAGEIIYHISDPSAILLRVNQSSQALYFATDLASHDYGRMQAQGPMFILTREIKRTPKDQRDLELKKRTQSMPILASIEPLDSLERSTGDKDRLLSGNITSELSDDGGLVLFAQIEDNDILRVIDNHSSTIQIQFMGAIIMGIMLCIAAVIVLWAIPLWRDLKRLVATTNQYGKGNLQARAKTSKLSVIAQLSTSFNSMADSVEKLILGHRELTNAIAHDLRTPLYRLRFAFEMLNNDNIGKEQREKYNNVVEKSIDDLDHLINQTLILSRYTRRIPNTDQIVPCVLEPILRAEIHHFQLEYPDLNVEFHCSSMLQEEKMMVDQRAMIRAMNNLLSNATRFARNTIVVTLERHPKNWVLTIEDDGIGIPQELWESVFDPFTQVNNEERDTTVGHGLGLAIVKQIAIWHDGDVFVSQSSLGGAKFTLSWSARSEENQHESRLSVVTNGHS